MSEGTPAPVPVPPTPSASVLVANVPWRELRELYLQMVPIPYLLKRWRSLLSNVSVSIAQPEAQAALLRQVFSHPQSLEFPALATYRRNCQKLFLSEIEDSLRQEEFPEGVLDELVDLVAGSIVDSPNSLGPSTESAFGKHSAEDALRERRLGDDLYFKSYTFKTRSTPAGGLNEYTFSVRVGPEFQNLGLAIWPAGIVLMQILNAALPDPALFRSVFGPLASPNGLEFPVLRFLELGAGIGATCAPVLRWAAPRSNPLCRVEALYLTDYQQVILDNCSFNVDTITVQLRSQFGAELPQRLPVVESKMLDWVEPDKTAALVAEWRPNVILAADVIYDRSVIPDLAETLKITLAAPGTMALLIATERNQETFQMFLDLVSDWCHVETVHHLNYVDPWRTEEFEVSGRQKEIGFFGLHWIDMSNLVQVKCLTKKVFPE
jgi:hypothetical protein